MQYCSDPSRRRLYKGLYLGYTLVWNGEPKKEEETALKKYQRLNCEVRELMEDIKGAAASGSENQDSLDKVIS